MRLVVPFEGDTKYVDLNIYQWRMELVFFFMIVLGWAAARPATR